MSKIWEFFENLNEYVYVSDIETYEIVYMNKKTRDEFKFSSLNQLKSQICYKLFQKNNSPCAICNNKELKCGFFKEWEYYNLELNKYFILKDTMIIDEGRKLRMEIAIDDSMGNLQANLLYDYQEIESIANEGFKQALKADTPEKSINVLLEYLGKALKGERTYIVEKNEKGNDDNTYEWCAKGITPEIQVLKDLPPNVCENWYKAFKEDKNIIIKDIEEIKNDNPIQYQILYEQNIHTIVVVPLFDDNKVIGFYGVDNPPKDKLEYVESMLQITGHFIVSALKRRNIATELKFMAHRDQLTKLGNRYALNEFIENLNPCNIGVIYGDITGLKRINDLKGHEEGDALILRTSNCIKNVFGDSGAFRIGGDEFLVLCPKISKKDLNLKVEELKKNMNENSVIMAIGVVWKKNSSLNIDELLKESEKLMYEEKASYYRKSGLDRRLI